MRTIELLAPAKNKEYGMEAIVHGADAVYIGAPKFGARSAAGNSLEDIAELIAFAHLYKAKVYVALNTIVKDEELAEAETLIRSLYAIHADAVIIQDMGILEMNLPPIALHASTQTDNRTLAKVHFLEAVGFDQIVLARELSLQQIKHIAEQTTSKIEVFVHGSLCVSYSGQCYISQSQTQRSANRGECAQLCRLPYDLIDSNGILIEKDKHLLSLKDLNQSDHLEELINAGVSSFKIEGRLKDISYVKNITAFYRQKLDAIIAQNSSLKRSSTGASTYTFTPNPEKTFQRSTTSYFLNKPAETVFSVFTPKSLGEKIGTVSQVEKDALVIQSNIEIANGDGLCFISKKQILEGFRVNTSKGNRIYPAEMPAISPQTVLYRNADAAFTKLVSKPSAERKIAIDIKVTEKEDNYTFSVIDEDGYSANYVLSIENQIAQKSQEQNIENQLSKLGNTVFALRKIALSFTKNKFLPSSLLTQAKRLLIEELLAVRQKNTIPAPTKRKSSDAHYPTSTLSYLGNVANRLAASFYQKHGVEKIEQAFELQKPTNNPILMFCKACIKDSLGYCPKKSKTPFPFQEPLFLVHKKTTFRIEFDCSLCEMHVRNEKEC